MVKKRINKARQTMKFDSPYHGQGFFVLVGLLMIFLTLDKLLGPANFSSDWFWFIAGVGITVEGFIMLDKQKKFNRKYKVVERK
jgi:hypothetical protein